MECRRCLTQTPRPVPSTGRAGEVVAWSSKGIGGHAAVSEARTRMDHSCSLTRRNVDGWTIDRFRVALFDEVAAFELTIRTACLRLSCL